MSSTRTMTIHELAVKAGHLFDGGDECILCKMTLQRLHLDYHQSSVGSRRLESCTGKHPLADNKMIIYADYTLVVTFTYTNYKGETAKLRVKPLCLTFKQTEHHPGPQWILEAYDLDKDAQRSFAMKDIRDWQPEVRS